MGDERLCGPLLAYESLGEGFLLAPVFSGKDGCTGKTGEEGCCSDVTAIDVMAVLLPVH